MSRPIRPAPAGRPSPGSIERAAEAAGVPYKVMASGAGHDSSVFANAGIPTVMLFIRNQNGSHNPDEAMDMADRAADALKKIVEGVEKTDQIMAMVISATAEQVSGSREVLKYVDTMRVSSDQVNRAMTEQAAGGKQIRQSIENMNKVAQQGAKAVREQAAGGRQIRLAVENMNRIMQEVSQAAKEQASGSKQIIGSVEGMNRMTQQVTVATSEQKRGGDLVVKSTENISSIARENLAAVEQMTKSSDELVGVAKALLDGVANFKA